MATNDPVLPSSLFAGKRVSSLPSGYLRMMSKCRNCGARILWARTPKGKAIPLDPKPHANGTIVLTSLGAMFLLPDDPRPAGRCYQSHFVTCRGAAKRQKAAKRHRKAAGPPAARRHAALDLFADIGV
jgi:hypothetical protein